MQNHSFHDIIVTCEHAGFLVPESYSALFAGQEEVLYSHRGWDPGALKLATVISVALGAPLITYIYSRLMIEPNRSEGHRSLFSEFTRRLPSAEKKHLINNYYKPYRLEIIQNLESALNKKENVVHISVHTFTPVLNGKERSFEIGLLYDPKRKAERKFCKLWKQVLRSTKPDLRVKMNKPYLGKSDGLTSYLRTKYSGKKYSGIELEVNQTLYDMGEANWNKVCHNIADSLRAVFVTNATK